MLSVEVKFAPFIEGMESHTYIKIKTIIYKNKTKCLDNYTDFLYVNLE